MQSKFVNSITNSVKESLCYFRWCTTGRLLISLILIFFTYAMHEVFNIIRDYNAIMPPFVNTYLPPSQHYYAETILNATVSLIFAVLLIGIIGRGWRSTTYFYLGEIGPRPIATNYCRCTLKTRVQLALPKW
ncbi:MAG: hypothetical protein ACXVH6_00700 [Halobacteriota archaeon]